MLVRVDLDLLELAIASDELRERDFSEVVILGGHPEHGHRFSVALPQTTGELHRGERFVNRVEWTSEQSRLLTRYDCDGFRIAQQFDVLQRFLPCAPLLVHARERVSQAIAI